MRPTLLIALLVAGCDVGSVYDPPNHRGIVAEDAGEAPACPACAVAQAEASADECSSCFDQTSCPVQDPPPTPDPGAEELAGPIDSISPFATGSGCAPIDACIQKVNKMCYSTDFTCIAFGFAVQMCLWYNSDPKINSWQQTVYYNRGTEEIGHMMLIVPHPDGGGSTDNPYPFCLMDVYPSGGCKGNPNICCWRQSTATPAPPDFCKDSVAQMRKKDGVAPTNVRFSGTAFWGSKYPPFTGNDTVRKKFEGCSGLDCSSWPKTTGTF